MAQLGHRVLLIERKRFPRRCLGESLSAGVLPLLSAVGAARAIENAGFPHVRDTMVSWDAGPQVRTDPQARGLIVDRGAFDRILLDHAVDQGVEVLQPARLVGRRMANDRWQLDIEAGSGPQQRTIDYLCIASGRNTANRRHGPRLPRTVAVYAYWRYSSDHANNALPRIESGDHGWFWSVPLPGGCSNTLAFLDPLALKRTAGTTLRAKLFALLAPTRFNRIAPEAALEGEIGVIDATPYLAPEPVSASMIRIGDAALAIDPISSSGVQKAIQSALSGAIVANTILKRREHSPIAVRFYEDHLARSHERHAIWAASHYATVAQHRKDPFWTDRAASAFDAPMPPIQADLPDPSPSTPLGLSPLLRFTDIPCLVGDFVETRPALSHPGLEEPVAYLGGRAVGARLRALDGSRTPLAIARSWSDEIPLAEGLGIVGWLARNALLTPTPYQASAP